MPTRVNNAKADSALSAERLAVETQHLQQYSILNNMPEAISVHATSSKITWANKKLCDIYSRPLSELQGLTCDQAFHGEAADCPHEQVLAAGSSVQIDAEVRVAERSFSVTIEPLRDQSNNPRGFTRVMRDVTSERRAHEQLLKAERYATLGQLLSAVAHNVGTPLNVISGYAEFLLMRKKNPEDQGFKELTAILDQTRRIAGMFGQALDMARPALGRTDAIDLTALLADSMDLVGHHLRTAGVTASLTCITDKPLIYGEASQFRQAFFNLLLNAGQCLGGGGTLQVVIDAADKPGFVGVAFLGTDASGAGHDFSMSLPMFFVTRSETESTGIGLHLTRKILSDAGALICCTEAGQQGVGLMVYLPVSTEKRT